MNKILSRVFNVLKALAPLAVLLVAWELVSRNIHVLYIFVPPPSEDFVALYNGLVNGTYSQLLWETLSRMGTAYFLAAILAIPCGLILGWKVRIYKIFEPIIEALRTIPSVAWIAPAIIFFGLSGSSVIFVTFYALFWLFLVFSLYGVYSIDKLALLSFRALDARDFHIFTKLIIPGAMTQIAAALRQAIAVAFIVTISGELILSVNGLGYYLLVAERTFAYPAIYATIMLISVVGYIINKVAIFLEGRFALKWAKESGIQSLSAP